jgi:hypothetical protein
VTLSQRGTPNHEDRENHEGPEEKLVGHRRRRGAATLTVLGTRTRGFFPGFVVFVIFASFVVFPALVERSRETTSR